MIMNPRSKSASRRHFRLAAPLALLALASAVSSAAQTAPAPSSSTPPEKPIPVEESKQKQLDETVQLSPFQVTSSNKGYFSSNTMSGTRMNSKIEDLGQSITVMTKEQMTDFAMLDINDVFNYMAST